MFHRPIWTCGRFNQEHSVAIMYNLIAGNCYFFEDESALVIGEILKADRDFGTITAHDICLALNWNPDDDAETVDEFLAELQSYGLLISHDSYAHETSHSQIVSQYRKLAKEAKQNSKPIQQQAREEKMPVDMLTAELEYSGRVGGVTSCMFELTYNCSEKCIHCYNPGAARNDKEESHRHLTKSLTFDEYKMVIDEMYDLGLYRVILTGGDPFSYPHTWDLLQYLYDKGIAIDIYTNGQMVSDKAAEIAELFPRSVGISLYSAIEDDHDFITGVKGSCAKTLKFIYGLGSLAVPMAIKCCIMKPNVRSYFTIYDVADKVGALPQLEINIVDSVDGDKCARVLRLSEEELEIVLRDNNLALYVGKEVPDFGIRKRAKVMRPCGAGEDSFCLTPDGWIIPCCAMHIHFGNVKEHTLKSILEGVKRKKWLNLTLEDYTECLTHDYCDYCNLCSGNNYAEHGDPTKAGENNCYTAKIRHSLATKMRNSGYDPLHGRTLAQSLMALKPYEARKYHRKFEDNISTKR